MSLGSEEIYQGIPHRPPFLFIDCIEECSAKKIITKKHLQAEEDYFRGHYPGHPIMPGVLICEAIFQSGALLLSKTICSSAGNSLPVLTKIKEAKFRRVVKPGEDLVFEVELTEVVSKAYYFTGKATVNGQLAVTIHFTCAMIPSI